MQQQDEQELITQSLNENHQAYGILVDRYKKAIYHHCFAIVRDEVIAEDIAQDAFIAAYYKLQKYNPQYKFSTWVFKIATNKALDWLKKTKREVRVDETVFESVPTTQPSPLVNAEYSELHRAIMRLAPRYRAVISLYYWQGLSYNDIAHALAVPEGSVKGWMRRAKDELKKDIA